LEEDCVHVYVLMVPDPPVMAGVHVVVCPTSMPPEAGVAAKEETTGSESTVKEVEETDVPGLAQVLVPPE
jgi:hypothetical protein